jgi:hypothetical protein
VLRRLILRTKDGRDASFGLRVRGPAIQNSDSAPGVTYLLDPDARYRVEFDDGLILHEILATNWQPPASDLPSEFHTDWPDRKREQHVLTGRVVDPDGGPLAGVRVRRTDHWSSPAPRITRRDGSFRIAIHGDRALLQFERPGFAIARREWRAPDANWAEPVRMGRAGRVRVRIDTPSDWRPVDWRLDVRAEGWPASREHELNARSRRSFVISRSLHVGQIGEDKAPGDQHLTVESGAEGVLVDLPEGTAELRLWTDGYERRLRVDVRTADEPVVAVFGLR